MKLIPCPHCGNELDTNSDSYSRLGKFYLSCMSAECGYAGPIRKTLEEAITATNTRSTDPLLKEMVETLVLLLDLPIASTELSYLHRGVGIATKNAAWLIAEDVLQKYHEQIK